MRKLLYGTMFLALLFTGACTDAKSHATGVYMLLDTSGTYTEELRKGQSIVNYLLGSLEPGDSLAVARIDSGSFSEKDIIAKMTFDNRPSVSNKQKIGFRDEVEKNVSDIKGSAYTDISGGMLQALEYLRETGSGKRYILIFSDLKEELPEGFVRDVPFELAGFTVIALNVTKLRADNVNPREYLDRLDEWQEKVEEGGGAWKVMNDLERLDRILEG
jgi:hypothetical protein